MVSILLVMTGGCLVTMADTGQIPIEDTSKLSISKAVDRYTDENLGLLKDKVTEEEKNELKKLARTKMYLAEKRKEKNELELGTLEDNISTHMNEMLNDYTIRYLLNGEELEDVGGMEEDSVESTTLSELKDVVTQEDYKRLEKLIEKYQSGNYLARLNINAIIKKYNSKDVDVIVAYLLENNSLELKASFDITEELDIEYKSIEGVTSTQLSQKEDKTYQDIWDDISFILPQSGMKNFDKIYFSTDGKYNVLASVIATNEEGSRWNINIDPNDVGDKSDRTLFYETIFHEYFHYISLNNTQVTYTDEYDMKKYCEYGFVSHSNSYINEFYNEFWKDTLDDRNADKESFYFYERHKDEFVSEYASTDVAEDVAETFAQFVLQDKPTGVSIKDEKIKFFYNYDELTKLREYLREKVNMD